MKAIFSPSWIRWFTSLLVLGSAATLSAREEHTQMHEASEALHAAQTAANPIEELEKARHSLEFAIKNKAGNRLEAIHFIDEAIDAMKSGKRTEANSLITKALGDIDKGVEVGQARHKK